MIRKPFLVMVGTVAFLAACDKKPDTQASQAFQRENEVLRRENTELKGQIEKLRSKKPVARQETEKPATPTPAGASKPVVEKPAMDKKGFSTVPKTAAAEKLVGNETKTYTVQQGDTLMSISRKIYHSPDRWKDIADANQNALEGSTTLKIGQVLILPQ